MRRRSTHHRLAPGHAPSPRLAWWAAFLTTIALIAIVNLARADAATLLAGPAPAPGFVSSATEEEEELLEEEEEEAEAGEGEEELFGGPAECEEQETECIEEEAEEEWPPRECRLTGTDAAIAAYPHGRKLRLTVRYSARVATQVSVSALLRGPRGVVRMDGERTRFGANGTFRENQFLSSAQLARALTARTATVEIRPLGAPRACHLYFDQRLTVKRSSARGPVWLGLETGFRVPSRR